MNNERRIIPIYYTTELGSRPARDFIDSLSEKEADRMNWVLDLFAILPPPISTKYFKKLAGTEHIWEVRLQLARIELRLLGFMDGSKLILTNGFKKKSGKTPPQEIEVAVYHRKRYYLRKA